MIFGRKKRLELELKIQEAKALEAKAKADEARSLNNAEHNKMVVLQMVQELEKENEPEHRELVAPEIPSNVVPKGKEAAIAMDSACSAHVYQTAGGVPQFFPLFEGFPKLAFMMQSSDYFSVVETTSNEMTREWGKFKIIDGDNSIVNKESQRELKEQQQDRVKQMNEAFERFGIKEAFNSHIRNELIFGRSQMFINLKGHDNSLTNPLIVGSETISKGSFKGVTVIEPTWSTPSFYNSMEATEPDFFKPDKWWVLGKEIHSDRLMTFVSRPVPDMYKPAYNFSGLSMLQLMQPYVERWQRSVDSVSDLLDSFSTSGIMTELGDVLSGDGGTMSQLLLRVAMFNKLRTNRGTMVLDKEKEEFFQVNTPLSGVPELMKHLQEQMGAPSHTPLVKLLGITPSGLNASSDGEIRVYYDYISALQERGLLWQIERIARIMQLHLFGDIDESVRFVFNPLYQLDAKEQAEKMATETMAFINLLQSGAVSPEEIRWVISKDESGPFGFIDPDEMPEPIEDYDYGEENESSALNLPQFGDKGVVQKGA